MWSVIVWSVDSVERDSVVWEVERTYVECDSVECGVGVRVSVIVWCGRWDCDSVVV